MTTKWVKPSQCIPMPELLRDFYDQGSYNYLKKIISEDGFDPAYPLKAIYSEKLGMYEVFDGIHRSEAAKALGLKKIPVIAKELSRVEALSEGYKANKTHARYNVMDQASHVLGMVYELCPELKGSKLETVTKFAGGRGKTSPYHEVSKRLGISYKTVTNLIALKTFSDEIQNLIGKGNLRYSVALEFLKIKGTKYEYIIPKIVDQAISENWSREETRRRIDSILKGSYHPFRACDLCGKGFPEDRINWMKLCPRCVNRLRQHYFEKQEPVTPLPSKDRSREVGRRKRGISTEELLGRIEKSRNKEKLRNGFQVSDSETPFMDYVKRVEEANEVRRKMGLNPLKRLRTEAMDKEVLR